MGQPQSSPEHVPSNVLVLRPGVEKSTPFSAGRYQDDHLLSFSSSAYHPRRPACLAFSFSHPRTHGEDPPLACLPACLLAFAPLPLSAEVAPLFSPPFHPARPSRLTRTRLSPLLPATLLFSTPVSFPLVPRRFLSSRFFAALGCCLYRPGEAGTSSPSVGSSLLIPSPRA